MTTKLRKLAKTLGNSRTFKEAAMKAGYSESTAEQVSSITERKGFKQLLETYLPLDGAFAVTKDSLTATKWNDFTGDREPDHNIRLKGAEQHYKLHGVYNDESTRIEGDVTININVSDIQPQSELSPGSDNLERPEAVQDTELA